MLSQFFCMMSTKENNNISRTILLFLTKQINFVFALCRKVDFKNRDKSAKNYCIFQGNMIQWRTKTVFFDICRSEIFRQTC